MAKILVVDDDLNLLQTVRDFLLFEHHIVETAGNGQDACRLLSSGAYDVAILDRDLPDMDGVEICRMHRQEGGTTPILMLTGKTLIDDKAFGFDAGADDYLTKPFHIKELSMRLKALQRRNNPITGETISVGDLNLNSKMRKVTKGGAELHLLPKEIALLEFLMRHQDIVFSADALLARVWDSDASAGISAVSTCIKRLRKKIDSAGKPSLIRTVHGAGYKMESS